MGTSINTAISPLIPLSRRVINDIEEHQRKVLDSYVEGMNRGMNIFPVQSSDGQEEEITTMAKTQKAAITQAETQEETLQLESLGTEDTSMNQADPIQGQDPTSAQAQNMEENEVPVAEDTSDQQVQVGNTDSQVNDEQQDQGNTDSQVNDEQQDQGIPEHQTSRALQDDNY